MRSLQALALRRGQLLAQAGQDRASVRHAIAPLAGAIRIVDQGTAVLRWVRERPLLVAAALGFLFVVRPKGSIRGLLRGGVRWLRYGVSAWQTWRWISGQLRSAPPAGSR
jgi:hypothetical protein